MLLRLLEVRGTLDAFLAGSSTGEFSNSRAQQPTADQWLTIRCLVVLLRPFADATDGLGGQKYPTLAIAVPVLRSNERKLKNEKMFDAVILSVSNEEFRGRVELLMHCIKKPYFKLFVDKFKNKLLEDLLWISVLDPRSAELKHLTHNEAALARTRLKSAAILMGMDMNARTDNGSECGRTSCALDPQTSSKKEKLAWLTDVFSGGIDEFDEEKSTAADEKLKDKCESEITLYAGDAYGTSVTTKPLKWWTKECRGKYPHYSGLSTSVPSKRAFSQSGNVITSKRCSLDPDIDHDIMFVGENYEENDVNISSGESDNSDDDSE
ncbi:hypothetical protein PHPALM_30461 [Phytophthora palmivora]|uniref:HAT C-terminal dimerisation domain-containing protein n=1 Tax=Phytophthora palmivora TaxID=4796 RepID=A0A2P4X540_9STRA|nr:hypothetical protein PHPALM_30461 [Phytophthora palmivora]